MTIFDTGSMQIERHVALLENESLDPWQYRMLSVYVVEGYLYVARALGWSRQALGRYLGLYVNPKDCYTIYRWEKGLARPRSHFRLAMSLLAFNHQSAYRRELARTTS